MGLPQRRLGELQESLCEPLGNDITHIRRLTVEVFLCGITKKVMEEDLVSEATSRPPHIQESQPHHGEHITMIGFFPPASSTYLRSQTGTTYRGDREMT